MAGRSLQVVRLVDDEEVDAGGHRHFDQARVVRQVLEGHDRTPVHLERVEVGTLVAFDLRDALIVEQHEYLVVLAPQLPQPLHGQAFGDNDQDALGTARVNESIHDEARLDGLAEADPIGEQPAHGVRRAGGFCSVQLVGIEANPPTQKRAQAVGLAQALELHGVDSIDEVLQMPDDAVGEHVECRLRHGHGP